jgi:hypothetical protein
MTTQTDKAARFHALHRPGNPLLLPNPWDQGSVGGALAFAALSAVADAAIELRDQGTYGYLAGSAAGRRAAQSATGRDS